MYNNINTLNWIWFIGCMRIDVSVLLAIGNSARAKSVIELIERSIREEGHRYGFNVGITPFPIFELPVFLEYYPEFIDAWLEGVDRGLIEADTQKCAVRDSGDAIESDGGRVLA